MGLLKYKAKRNLKASKEPAAKKKQGKSDALIFVIQEHHARHLHFDLRLEAGGVLKSWAVPKRGASSTIPSVKRLAIHVEDHPYSYKDFEGIIPSGYGKGTVRIWDKGTYTVKDQTAKESEKSIKEGLKKGVLHFTLQGKKLKGEFLLIRLNNSAKDQWLLMKKKETAASKPRHAELTHLDKLYWPKEKITKGDLIKYYDEIAPYLLPYLKDRPESLRRYPNGITGQTFFQKNLVNHPDWVTTAALKHKEGTVNYTTSEIQK